MGKGFPGLPGGMQGLMKQAQKMQEDLAVAQREAENFSAEGSAGGGVVKAVATGKYEFTSISISREAVSPDDVEMLQDLVLAACNDALGKVKANLKDKMSKVTGGMNLPGLF
ncbi:MAG: YbaB/EbfC family nucleoid-associated protein [Deltaproteobacteria bacterium]|nr:YbaB/EbfC family nucleoid-associated protein [Deltaproteobacteria bacterium]